MNCPSCERKMDRDDGDPNLNRSPGFICYPCDVFIFDWEIMEAAPKPDATSLRTAFRKKRSNYLLRLVSIERTRKR